MSSSGRNERCEEHLALGKRTRSANSQASTDEAPPSKVFWRNQTLLNTFRATTDEGWLDFIEFIGRHRPYYVAGYAGSLYQMAKDCAPSTMSASTGHDSCIRPPRR